MARVNIKADSGTRERLRALKGSDETWDELLNRLAEYGELVDKTASESDVRDGGERGGGG